MPRLFRVCRWSRLRSYVIFALLGAAGFALLLHETANMLQTNHRSKQRHILSKSMKPKARDNGPIMDAIIIGAEKSGTAAISNFLILHSQIDMSGFLVKDVLTDPKEAKTWKRTHVFPHPPNGMDGKDKYVMLADYPTGLIEENTAKVIHHLLPDVKLIVAFKNPVDRAVSHYTHLRKLHIARLRSGQSRNASARYELNFSFKDLAITPEGEVRASYGPIFHSIYMIHLEKWLEYFPLSSFHFVDGDKLVGNPMTELQKLETFLGVEPEFNEDWFYFNKTKGYYCAKSQKRSVCLGSDKGSKHPMLKSEHRSVLEEFFSSHNAALFQVLKRKFDW